VLELRDIEAGYGETTVLRSVSLAVPPSSVVALLGPNGAGKTTLLKVASGLLRPSAGGVCVTFLRVGGSSRHCRCGRTCCCK
jgi:branched-chain amino acid transport system ATP-binding protein